MMTVMQDNSVVWGSDKHLPSWKHGDVANGDVIYENTAGLKLIAADGKGGNCTPGLDVSTTHINADKEIAIQYEGSAAPILALTNAAWDNWTEISAFDIDEEKGIAYYSYDAIKKAWGDDISTIAHLFARAGSDMTIYRIAALPAAELVTDPTNPTDPTDPTKPTDPDLIELGDVNHDGDVSIADVVMLQRYLLRLETTADLVTADLNGDGVINGMDLGALRQLVLS